MSTRVLVVTMLAIAPTTGCCRPPSGPWDQSAAIPSETLAGVVAVVQSGDGTSAAGCVGSVVKNVPTEGGFDVYVLTARHCILDDDQRPAKIGVSLPRTGDIAFPLATPVFVATTAHVALGEASHSVETVEWRDDWAIVRAAMPGALPTVRLFAGDPELALSAGTLVTMPAFLDRAYFDASIDRLRLHLHEHSFGWTGVPQDVVQGGHSGAPLLWHGQVVALFSGAVSCSRFCATFVKAYATKLSFVSIATIRREATEQGFAWE